MVVLGILLIVLGAFSALVVDSSLDVGSQVWDMDLIGGILVLAGVASTLLGLFMTAMYTTEEHDVLVDHVPGEAPKRIVRRRKRT